ncbi:MAG: hypothetical protein NC098_05985 [Lachnoclostridium sp.]|nr:hypothetical protein [Lachnoclostridium sp.]
MSEDTTETWYVLNFVNPGNSGSQQAQTIVDSYNVATSAGLQLFAPTYVMPVEVNGKTIMRQARLAFHYLFLRGTIDHIKALCALENGFSLLIDRSSSTHRYATVTDQRMQAFRAIALAYSNSLPFYNLDNVDLLEGDIVQIVNGSFPGIIVLQTSTSLDTLRTANQEHRLSIGGEC